MGEAGSRMEGPSLRHTRRATARNVRISLAAAALFLAPQGVRAAALSLPDATYTYMVIDQDLVAALQEFGSNLRIKVNVSPEVKGRIQGRIPEGSAMAFLERLAATYNLEWYYDGSVLFVTSARENRTQLLVLSPIGYDTLKRALDALQIGDARFPIRPAPGNGMVMVSGPPRYVALVEQTLAGLVAEEQARPKPVAAAPKAAAPAKTTVLTVFRGGQMTVIRDGRPERLIGPEADPSPRIDLPASAGAAGRPEPAGTSLSQAASVPPTPPLLPR